MGLQNFSGRLTLCARGSNIWANCASHYRILPSVGYQPHLEAMGERWSFMILRAAFNGIRHFEDFLTEISIARNILANRLSRLSESGILHRTPCPDDRRKVEYRLTEKGLDLLPTMIALRQWGEKWGTGVPSNPVLVDELIINPSCRSP